jgi:hypothetical protein
MKNIAHRATIAHIWIRVITGISLTVSDVRKAGKRNGLTARRRKGAKANKGSLGTLDNICNIKIIISL